MKSTKKKYIIILIVFMLLFACGFTAKSFFSKGAINVSSATDIRKIAVAIQKSESVETVPKLTFKGTVEPCQFSVISSKISGRIENILFENGNYVEKGTPLVLLDDQEMRNQLTATNHQLELAENQLVTGKTIIEKAIQNKDVSMRNFDRQKERYEKLEIPMEEFEKARDALNMADLELQSTMSNVETVKLNIETVKISINTINDNIENAVIRAPTSGIIDEKNVSVGQYITIQGSTTIIAKVKDISSVDAVIQLSQDDYNFVKEGQPAKVLLNDQNEGIFEGVVKTIDKSADPISRTFKCKISIDNSNKLLKPGAFVTAEISKNEKKQIVAIPIHAMAGTEGAYYIYVAENGYARKKNITIGDIIKDKVEVTKGLAVNVDVITTNLNVLQDGDAIEISKT